MSEMQSEPQEARPEDRVDKTLRHLKTLGMSIALAIFVLVLATATPWGRFLQRITGLCSLGAVLAAVVLSLVHVWIEEDMGRRPTYVKRRFDYQCAGALLCVGLMGDRMIEERWGWAFALGAAAVANFVRWLSPIVRTRMGVK